MRIPRGERKLSVRLCNDKRNVGEVTFDRHRLSDPLLPSVSFLCASKRSASLETQTSTRKNLSFSIVRRSVDRFAAQAVCRRGGECTAGCIVGRDLLPYFPANLAQKSRSGCRNRPGGRQARCSALNYACYSPPTADRRFSLQIRTRFPDGDC
jgi:hypothetical protein